MLTISLPSHTQEDANAAGTVTIAWLVIVVSMTDVHITEVKTVHARRVSKIEGGSGVGRRVVAAASVDSQHGVHTTQVEKVIVQRETAGGGLSGVGRVQESRCGNPFSPFGERPGNS